VIQTFPASSESRQFRREPLPDSAGGSGKFFDTGVIFMANQGYVKTVAITVKNAHNLVPAFKRDG
jgi:hypothetical protein